MSKQKANEFGWPSYKAVAGEIYPASIKDFGQFFKCILGIDLGARNFKDGRLEACVQWISENFDSCIVAIADTAHQYTLQLMKGINASAANEEAIRAGKAFVTSYRPLFDKYSRKCSFDFMFLSELAETPSFKENNQILTALYRNDSSFAKLAESYAKSYPQSVDMGDQIFDELSESGSRQRQLAVSHLIDELTMFACLKQQKSPLLVYPRAIKPLSEIVEGRYPDAPQPLTSLAYTAPRLTREKAFFAPEADDAEEFELLPQFSNDEWEKLISYTVGKPFKSNDVLVEYGQEDRSMYILAEGTADVFLPDGKDGSKKIATIGKGTVFGELALLDGKPRSATVTGTSDGLLFQLGHDDFNQLRAEDSGIACSLLFDIGRVLALRNRKMNQKVQNIPL